MITAWRVFGLMYAAGVALVIRDKYRKQEREERMPDRIEDQLDIMIHTSEINERSAQRSES